MRYLLLICVEEPRLDALPQADRERLARDHVAYVQDLRRRGGLVAAQALQQSHSAVTLRVRNGKVCIVDGPFAASREQVGAFYLIEARDLNEAIQVAARIPSAPHGSVEVRPVGEA
jgi:hypothetical protein